MKITKKDKIVLLVLLFVLIIGIFLMYGVMPANDELKELKAKELELETKLQQLQSNYNIHNPLAQIDKMENLLHEYYTTEDGNEDIIFVAEPIIAYVNFKPICMDMLDSLYYDVKIDKAIEDPKSTVFQEAINKEDIGGALDKDKQTSLIKAKATYMFSVNTPEEVADILDTFNNNPNLHMVNFSFSLNEGRINGTINVVKYYIESTKYIPLPLVNNPNNFNLIDLEDAPSRPIIDTLEKTLTFETIKNAEYYEIYEVFFEENEFGEMVFDHYSSNAVITNILPEENEEGIKGTNVVVKYDNRLKESTTDEKHYYVAVAVGNYEQCWYGNPEGVNKVYYRTIMSKYLADNKFEI